MHSSISNTPLSRCEVSEFFSLPLLHLQSGTSHDAVQLLCSVINRFVIILLREAGQALAVDEFYLIKYVYFAYSFVIVIVPIH